jgi:hypothetical protein
MMFPTLFTEMFLLLLWCSGVPHQLWPWNMPAQHKRKCLLIDGVVSCHLAL